MVVNVDTDFGTASSPNASVFNISPVWDSVRGKVVMLFNLQRAQYNTWTGLTNPKARETYVIVSTDSGVTWSSPRNITAQLQHEAPWAASRNPEAVTPGPGIQLKDGTLLVPGYGCPLPAAASCTTYSLTSTMRMWALRSVDGGDTWTMGKPAANVGAGEPMAIQRPDGVLVMNARPVQWPHDDKPHPDRHRLYALSSDGGVTWEPPGLETFTNLTGPSCEASFVRSDDLVLFANPANNIRRINMTFRVSKDWGATWQSTVVYGNSSWYSSIAVVPASAREHASTSTALLFFSKDCDSPIAADPTTRETDHCKSISLWKTPL
jgi:sialidase-1